MKIKSSFTIVVAFIILPLLSCRKNGLKSPTAKKIQFRWEHFSGGSATDYLNGQPLNWTIRPAAPNTFYEFTGDGYFYDVYISGSNTKYVYDVDGDKILYLLAGGPSRPTTPQYTDTFFINHVDDNLLVLSHKKYFASGAYSYITSYIDSLKK